MKLQKLGRRLFLQASATGATKRAVAFQSEKLNPVGKLKKALQTYGDATSAKKMAKLAQGDKISMSRRNFLKGAGREAAALVAKNPKKVVKPIAGAVGNVLNPVDAAGKLSGVKLGRIGSFLKSVGGGLGLYSRNSNIIKFRCR